MTTEKPPTKRTPKEVAIETLSVVIARLKGPQWLDELERKTLALACEHAQQAVATIEELKRARSKPKDPESVGDAGRSDGGAISSAAVAAAPADHTSTQQQEVP